MWPCPSKEPLPRGDEIYNFGRPLLRHHYSGEISVSPSLGDFDQTSRYPKSRFQSFDHLFYIIHTTLIFVLLNIRKNK